MKKYILGALAVLLIFMVYRYFENRNAERDRLEESTALIQQQIKNVGKLVVTEGTFSQVYTYKDTKNRFLDVLPARKRALIIVNTKATVAYDLSKLVTEVDVENKTVHIKHIPEEEINIYPDIKYYDITQDYLNQFTADDYNKIKTRINKSMREKVENSTLKSNAKNRLISELQKIYILTNTLGWTLTYNDQEFSAEQEMQELKL
ncbi:DUF4230 domain-containing protein [Salinimicrobium sp. MT39]|uniref:DUF4230 domain-containing protein n=1 Tax=Salinimicrobium profundisediminis TaxID=2994553 RepID=A0A9X3I1I6_9FLAO|nr:DUF4230 domain-containing protein [Salinimicrobium profundisediminis]MCX2839120.1 DUF4230 domain-containing protein [Salinimicrobium profundisediminis]